MGCLLFLASGVGTLGITSSDLALLGKAQVTPGLTCCNSWAEGGREGWKSSFPSETMERSCPAAKAQPPGGWWNKGGAGEQIPPSDWLAGIRWLPWGTRILNCQRNSCSPFLHGVGW